MEALPFADLKTFLDEKYEQYNRPDFVPSDPISIPHRFTNPLDIEIAGFLAATIAWGQRVTIIKNANWLVERMDLSPYDFVKNASAKDLKVFESFKHRTFNGEDCIFFLQSLQHLYQKHGSLENAFTYNLSPQNREAFDLICNFRKAFFSIEHPKRTSKHVSDPSRGSSAKRLNMFLRWMVRQDKLGVDFGIWKSIAMSQLSMPLDVHTGNVGRKLGLITRKQNDWKTVAEFDANLRALDPNDPVKYDFALFGLGVFEKF